MTQTMAPSTRSKSTIKKKATASKPQADTVRSQDLTRYLVHDLNILMQKAKVVKSDGKPAPVAKKQMQTRMQSTSVLGTIKAQSSLAHGANYAQVGLHLATDLLALT